MIQSLRAVAEPHRREILQLVWDRERAAGEIASRFDVSFPAISQHLKILREAGLVSVRKEGRSRFYRARPEEMGPLREVLEVMWAERLGRLRALAETAEATRPEEDS